MVEGGFGDAGFFDDLVDAGVGIALFVEEAGGCFYDGVSGCGLFHGSKLGEFLKTDKFVFIFSLRFLLMGVAMGGMDWFCGGWVFWEGDFRRFPGVWRDLRDFGGGDLEEGEIGLGGRLGG